jgi:hypothetical protein
MFAVDCRRRNTEGRKRATWSPPLFLASFVCLILAALLMRQSLFAQSVEQSGANGGGGHVATITKIDGVVELQSSAESEFKEARLADKVYTNSLVSVNEGGEAEITYLTGEKVSLTEFSMFSPVGAKAAEGVNYDSVAAVRGNPVELFFPTSKSALAEGDTLELMVGLEVANPALEGVESVDAYLKNADAPDGFDGEKVTEVKVPRGASGRKFVFAKYRTSTVLSKGEYSLQFFTRENPKRPLSDAQSTFSVK